MNMNDEKRLVQTARFVVVIPLVLFIIKIFIGILSMSISVISDALDSLMDMAAGGAAYYFIKESRKPPDESHSYGHGKFESLSALFQSAMMATAAVIIILAALNRIIHGIDLVKLDIVLAGLAFSMVLKYIISRKMFKVSKEENSIALEAAAHNFRMDMIISAMVIVGIVIIQFGEYLEIDGIEYIDPAIAVIIALSFIKVALSIAFKTSKELLDTSLSENDQKIIDNVLREFKGYHAGIHNLRTRQSGNEKHIDFHIQLKKDLSIEKGHEIVNSIERKIEEKLERAHVLVHMEPCKEDCEVCSGCEKTSED